VNHSDKYALYRLDHRYCPKCRSGSIGETIAGKIVLDLSITKDENEAVCVCGWKGIVHDLVGVKRIDYELYQEFKAGIEKGVIKEPEPRPTLFDHSAMNVMEKECIQADNVAYFLGKILYVNTLTYNRLRDVNPGNDLREFLKKVQVLTKCHQCNGDATMVCRCKARETGVECNLPICDNCVCTWVL